MYYEVKLNQDYVGLTFIFENQNEAIEFANMALTYNAKFNRLFVVSITRTILTGDEDA